MFVRWCGEDLGQAEPEVDKHPAGMAAKNTDSDLEREACPFSAREVTCFCTGGKSIWQRGPEACGNKDWAVVRLLCLSAAGQGDLLPFGDRALHATNMGTKLAYGCCVLGCKCLPAELTSQF